MPTELELELREEIARIVADKLRTYHTFAEKMAYLDGCVDSTDIAELLTRRIRQCQRES